MLTNNHSVSSVLDTTPTLLQQILSFIGGCAVPYIYTTRHDLYKIDNVLTLPFDFSTNIVNFRNPVIIRSARYPYYTLYERFLRDFIFFNNISLSFCIHCCYVNCCNNGCQVYAAKSEKTGLP